MSRKEPNTYSVGEVMDMVTVLINSERLKEAEVLLRKVLAAHPDHATAWAHMGLIASRRGKPKLAHGLVVRALGMDPCETNALTVLVALAHKRGRLEEALKICRRTVAAAPDRAGAFNNLAVTHRKRGEFKRAARAYGRALYLEPDNQVHVSNYLFLLTLSLEATADEVAREHRIRAASFVSGPAPEAPDFSCMADHSGPMNIGYVSPDFRSHSVANFIAPVIEGHDREKFKVFCYASVEEPDNVTRRFRAMDQTWRDISGATDEQAAEMVRRDRIHILVDLAGHTGGNRLGVLAKRPAPVQVSWLGYPNTTGLETVDYRITDPVSDPPGMTEHLHTETLARMDPTFLCYSPLDRVPLAQAPPCLANGYATYGSFNTLSKTNHRVIDLWAELLRRDNTARLLLKSRESVDDETLERFMEVFARAGVQDRVDMIHRAPTPAEHLAMYSRMDVALDPFPYNGTTTTVEALWMGVPVVSLAGDRHVARMGASILSAVGLPELAPDNDEAYLETAMALARDKDRLARMRGNLRQALLDSPLMDHKRQVRSLEKLYLEMWENWRAKTCAGNK